MALTDKLTAIADAIRGKTGGTEAMTLDQMPTEIAGIKTDPILEPLTVTENGAYTPGEGVDGFSKVTVNVAGSGGAEMETGTLTPVDGKCYIETSLTNVSAALIWAEVPSGEYYYTLNTYTIYSAVLGLMADVGSRRSIMHTTNNAQKQFANYDGGIEGNIISFERVSNAQGYFRSSQIIDEAGTTEPITYRWVAFGGVTIDL